MCGRFVLMTVGRELAERFQLMETPSLVPRYNVAPTQQIAVIRSETETGRRRLGMLKWGLIPFWAKDVSIGSKMINARSETVAEKPAFRAAFKHRRCLIPADGFYEWKTEQGIRQPFFVYMADGKPFAFAGLWEMWKDPDGNPVESCTILTTDANALLLPIHDRMPAILSPEEYGEWLSRDIKDVSRLKALLHARAPEEMALRRANPKVNSPSYEGPECLQAPRQGSE